MVFVYCLTNEYSKDINVCLLLYSAFNPKQHIDDKTYLTTYSISYYNNGHYNQVKRPSTHDFKYVLEIELYDNLVYTVRTKNDIIKNMFHSNGLINLSVVSQYTKTNIKGVILYDIPSVKKSDYIPYFILPSDCVKKITIKYTQRPTTRLWKSVESCDEYNRIQCINSESCSLEDKKKNSSAKKVKALREMLEMNTDDEMCVQNPKHTNMLLSKLNTVMLPFKYYIFTEFPTSPFDINIEEQPSSWFKPQGLWFALGAEWLQHMKKTNFRMTRYNYLYSIEVDLNKLILITNMTELHKFSSLYCKPSQQYGSVCYEVNWRRAIRETKKAGILISPNLKHLINKHKPEYVPTTTFSEMEWYVTWDVASGAIWNAKAITHISLIYQREPGKFTSLQK